MSRNIEILKELKLLLTQKAGEDIRDVVLFGSQTQKKSKEGSDYDILIVLKRKYSWPERRNLIDICYEVSLKHDIFIDSKIISVQELEETPLRSHPLYKNALMHGIYA